MAAAAGKFLKVFLVCLCACVVVQCLASFMANMNWTSSKPMDDPEVVALIEQVRRDAGIREPVSCAYLESPQSVAFIQRRYRSFGPIRIYISRPFLKSLTTDEKLALVAHELGHLWAGDLKTANQLMFSVSSGDSIPDALALKFAGREALYSTLRKSGAPDWIAYARVHEALLTKVPALTETDPKPGS